MTVHSVIGAEHASLKGNEAWAWAIRLTEYSNKNSPTSVQAEVVQDVTGRGNRIIWVNKHDSLDDAEKHREWVDSDEGVQKLILESVEEELMDWSTLNRSYYRVRS